MKKRKYKKLIVCLVVLSCSICCFMLPFSSYAVADTDISNVFNNFSLIKGVSWCSSSHSVTAGSFSLPSATSISATYPGVVAKSSVLYTFNYYDASTGFYPTIEDDSHYVFNLGLNYRYGSDISGHDFKLVLFAVINNGLDYGTFVTSVPVSYTYHEELLPMYSYYRFDVDISLNDDWPTFINGSEAYLCGWGLVDNSYVDNGSVSRDVVLNINSFSCTRYSATDWQTIVLQENFDNIHSQVVQGMQEYDQTLPDSDYSEGQAALDEYGQANDAVESMIDSGSVTDSLADGSDVLGGWLDGIKYAGMFINSMYNSIVTYYGVIPVLVMFSAVALLLGLVKNR